MADETHWLMHLLLVDSWVKVWIALFGLSAQGIFMSRMVVQWIATERAKRSVIPVPFWWLSILGATMLLIYGILDRDIVIILAQTFGFVVYARNLWFIYAERGANPEGDR